LEKSDEGVSNEPQVVCPVSCGSCRLYRGHYSAEPSLFYPTVCGVPVLYKKYAQVITADLLTVSRSRQEMAGRLQLLRAQDSETVLP